MASIYLGIVALWATGLGVTYYTQNGNNVNPAVPAKAPSPSPSGGDGVTAPPLLMGSWDYYAPNNRNFSWTADDFVYRGDDGKEHVWQNFIIPFGQSNYDYAAQVYTQVYNRTGYKLLVFWGNAQWNTLNDIQSVIAAYNNLTQYYSALPATPSGFFLYDEPTNSVMDGTANSYGLVNLTATLKQKYPDAYIYANFLYSTPQDPHYAALIGNSSLDYISSDQYDTPWQTYKAMYVNSLYPYLKPTQRVLLVPWTSYGSDNPSTFVLDPPSADQRCLYGQTSSATNFYAWMQSDPWVYGMVIYRLKNVWSASYAGTYLSGGTTQDGIGLVDRVAPQGAYIMPNTVRYYQQLGIKWTYSGTK